MTLLAGAAVVLCAARGAECQVVSNSVTGGLQGFSGRSAALGSSSLGGFRTNSASIGGQTRTSSSSLLWAGSRGSGYSPSRAAGARPRTNGRRVDRKVGSGRRSTRVSGARRARGGAGRSKIISRNKGVPNYGGGGGSANPYGSAISRTGYAGRLGGQRQRRSALSSRQSLRYGQVLSSQAGRGNMRSLRERGR